MVTETVGFSHQNLPVSIIGYRSHLNDIPGLKNHSERVRHNVKLLAELNHATLEQISWLDYADLHDIGKTHVSLDILEKNGALTTSEYDHVKQHVRYGLDMLKGLVPEETLAIIGGHHEWQENPYPRHDHRAGSKIQDLQQILSVADHADVLQHPRNYMEQRMLSDDEFYWTLKGRLYVKERYISQATENRHRLA